MKNTNMRNSLLLTLTALIWGIAFVSQKYGGDAVGCFTFNATRSFIGGIVLIPVILFMDRRKTSQERRRVNLKGLIFGGFCCGVMLFLGSNLQQIGIKYTSASKAGFITALYIVLVPIFGLLLGKKITLRILCSVIIAVLGMYFLCINGKAPIEFGDFSVLVSAFWFALHILVIDHFVRDYDGVKLSCIQFFTCGILSGIMIPFYESPSIHALVSAWLPIGYAGIMSCGVAYTLQIVGQKNMNPTVASLILSLESVFAVIAGMLLLNEILSIREIIGCVLIFAAIILTQIPQKIKQKG